MRPLNVAALGCAAALSVASIATPAFAQTNFSYTQINPPLNGEPTHGQILSQIYGGTFTQSGLNYSNGIVSVERMPDLATTTPTGPDVIVPMATSGDVGLDDRFWQADFRFASAEAKFAAFNQNFGYYNGTTSMSYNQLFTQSGTGYGVSGEADLTLLSNQMLRWARGGDNRVVSSNPSDNRDGLDHMVTYKVDFGGVTSTSPNGAPAQQQTWLLFFEDKFIDESYGDFDFNDLVVEVTAGPAVSTPEPVTALSAVSMTGAGLLMGRRRRATRSA